MQTNKTIPEEQEETPPDESREGSQEDGKDNRGEPSEKAIGHEIGGASSECGSGAVDLTRFPNKLHRMLTEIDADADGDLAEAVSWQPHGRCT